MFVVRFDFRDGETLYMGRIGKGTTAGGWGFTSYEDASTFPTEEAAKKVITEHYPGPAGDLARIVDSFDETDSSNESSRPGS